MNKNENKQKQKIKSINKEVIYLKVLSCQNAENKSKIDWYTDMEI